MFRLFTGENKAIKETMQQIAKQYNMELKYSHNIFNDLNKQYGLFYTPKILYFIYDAKDFKEKTSVDAFLNKVNKSKVPVLCIIETDIDKRSSFYKTFNKQIETIGKPKKQEQIQSFDNISLATVPTNEAVSVLYKMFYDFKNPQNRKLAGECINLVLTGQVKTEQIIKVFLYKRLTN